MALFSAFSPLNGGAMNTYGYPTESPYDLDAGLDFTRKATGFADYPFPVVIGYIEGVIPTHDKLEYMLMKGKEAFGPMLDNGVIQGALPQMVFPNIMGSMAKVTG